MGGNRYLIPLRLSSTSHIARTHPTPPHTRPRATHAQMQVQFEPVHTPGPAGDLHDACRCVSGLARALARTPCLHAHLFCARAHARARFAAHARSPHPRLGGATCHAPVTHACLPECGVVACRDFVVALHQLCLCVCVHCMLTPLRVAGGGPAQACRRCGGSSQACRGACGVVFVVVRAPHPPNLGSSSLPYCASLRAPHVHRRRKKPGASVPQRQRRPASERRYVRGCYGGDLRCEL